MPRLTISVAIVGAILALGLPQVDYLAAEPPIRVELVPSQVQLSEDEEEQLAVQVSNDSAEDLGVAVTLASIADVASARASPSRLVIPAGESDAINLSVQGKVDLTDQREIIVRVSYDGVDRSGSISKVLTLVPRPPIDPAKFRVTSQSSALRVDDVHDSQFSILIENSSSQDANVTNMRINAPVFISVSSPDVPFTVPARSTQAITFTVRGVSPLQRGTVQAAVVMGLSIVGDDRSLELAVVQDLEVGAFGESELGQLLTIPTLLVLPGTVLLALIALLWSVNVRPVGRRQAMEFPAPAASLTFWVVAVGLSLAAVGLASVLKGSSLYAGYGTADIAWTVAYTALVGSAAYVVFGCLIPFAFRRRRQRRLDLEREAQTITVGQHPMEVLRALGARDGQSLWLPTASQLRGTTRRNEIVVQTVAAEGTSLICPPIEISLLTERVNIPDGAIALEEHLLRALTPNSSLKLLLELLEENRNKEYFSLRWQRSPSGLQGVESVHSLLLEQLATRVPLIRLA